MQEDREIQKLFGVIGYPLGHSFSPLLHNWGFDKCNLQYIYMKWPIDPKDLGAFMVSMYTLPIHGVSVTIPFKQMIMPYLDEITPEARKIGAVNTLYWENNMLCGENTDWYGFLQPLRVMDCSVQNALILGAGGAALACIVGLKNMGVCDIYVAARKKDRLKELRDIFGIVPVDWLDKENCAADLLVNSTPLGMCGEWQMHTPFEGSLEGFKYVYDLIYNPVQTDLLARAEATGRCVAVSGLDMFIYQALEQFRIWTGQGFPVTEAESMLRQYL